MLFQTRKTEYVRVSSDGCWPRQVEALHANINILHRPVPPLVSLDVMARDAAKMRGTGPTVFAQVTGGVGVDEIATRIEALIPSRSPRGSLHG